jgi:Tol biopolymer transport system component
MIEIPDRFPLPQDAFERQRSLLGTYVVGRQHPSPSRVRGVVAVAAVIVAGGLLVTPALGIGSRLLDLIQGFSPPRPTREAGWSPDGRKILYVSRSERNTWDLYVINVDGSGQRRLTSVSSASAAWSPDGRKIAFQGPLRAPDASHPRRVRGALWVINADGSGKRRLAPKGEDPAWSPDGRTIAFATFSGIYVVNADGTGQRGLAGTSVAGSRTGGHMSSPAWSPDGRKVLFLSDAGTLCDFCFHLYVVNADGSGERRLEHKDKTGPRRMVGDFSPAWSPDGQRIAFVRRSFLPTGLDVGVVWVMRADGREQRKLTRERRAEGRSLHARVAWSPDGRKLAFASGRDGNAEVYTINTDGSGLRRLTDSPEYDGDAVWSPDGRQLVFVSNRDGGYAVYLMNADGSEQRRLTTR